MPMGCGVVRRDIAGSAKPPIDKSPSMARNLGLTNKARVATAIAERRGHARFGPRHPTALDRRGHATPHT
jgi:hypothetical protein